MFLKNAVIPRMWCLAWLWPQGGRTHEFGLVPPHMCISGELNMCSRQQEKQWLPSQPKLVWPIPHPHCSCTCSLTLIHGRCLPALGRKSLQTTSFINKLVFGTVEPEGFPLWFSSISLFSFFSVWGALSHVLIWLFCFQLKWNRFQPRSQGDVCREWWCN